MFGQSPSQNPDKTEQSPGMAVRLRRKQAAYLLEQVVGERMDSRLAINRWPVIPKGELEDVSLAIAYQALWHFESDEEKQQTEMFYLDAQLDLLGQIAAFLKENRELPAYIRQNYPPLSRPCLYEPRNFYQSIVRDYWNIVRPWVRAWQKVMRFGRKM